jgi:hypothetical protein
MGRIVMAPLLALLIWTCVATAPAHSEEVDVALVLVTDVSRSIDDSEFKLEKDGYANAFTSRRVLDAIHGGPAGQIAVAYVEFAAGFEVRTVLGWTLIRDRASAQHFVDKLSAAPRSFQGRTAIGAGIERAMRLLAEIGVHPTRQVIDVCGDGTSNNGPDVTRIRDDAVSAGITINGLAIINDHPVSWNSAHVQPPGGLANYYRENVTGGPASFVLEVHDFSNFAEAKTRKLVQEIAVGQAVSKFASQR